MRAGAVRGCVGQILTPAIVLFEVYKKIKRERSEEEALIAVAQIEKTRIAPGRRLRPLGCGTRATGGCWGKSFDVPSSRQPARLASSAALQAPPAYPSTYLHPPARGGRQPTCEEKISKV